MNTLSMSQFASQEDYWKARCEIAEARLKQLDKVKEVEYAWECNDCGSQEYTMCVSEDDVNRLGCGNCGGDEWHKAIAE